MLQIAPLNFFCWRLGITVQQSFQKLSSVQLKYVQVWTVLEVPHQHVNCYLQPDMAFFFFLSFK